MNYTKKFFDRWIGRSAGNDSEISLFDVKQLYDAAYEEKAKARVCLRRFRQLLAQAEKLDVLYRAQLASATTARYGRAA